MKIGDVVQFKSGGALMVVIQSEKKPAKEQLVRTAWMTDKKALRDSAWLPVSALEIRSPVIAPGHKLVPPFLASIND